MSKISLAVGTRWEKELKSRFPNLEKLNSEDNILPDFYNPKFNFWMEAKSACYKYGIRAKQNQVNSFNKNDEVIYAIGFHNLYPVGKNLRGLKTTKGMINRLERISEISHIYFVTNEMLIKIFEMEKRISREKKTPYCIIKPGHLDALIKDKQFRRKGIKYFPEEYYGFSREDFLIRPINGDKPGLIIDPNKDENFIKFLESEKLL